MTRRFVTPFCTLEGDVVALPFTPRPITEMDVARGFIKVKGWYTSQGGKKYLVVYWVEAEVYTVYDEDYEPVGDFTAETEDEAVAYITETLDMGAPTPAPARRYLLNGPVATRLRALLGF